MEFDVGALLLLLLAALSDWSLAAVVVLLFPSLLLGGTSAAAVFGFSTTNGCLRFIKLLNANPLVFDMLLAPGFLNVIPVSLAFCNLAAVGVDFDSSSLISSIISSATIFLLLGSVVLCLKLTDLIGNKKVNYNEINMNMKNQLLPITYFTNSSSSLSCRSKRSFSVSLLLYCCSIVA